MKTTFSSHFKYIICIISTLFNSMLQCTSFSRGPLISQISLNIQVKLTYSALMSHQAARRRRSGCQRRDCWAAVGIQTGRSAGQGPRRGAACTGTSPRHTWPALGSHPPPADPGETPDSPQLLTTSYRLWSRDEEGQKMMERSDTVVHKSNCKSSQPNIQKT